MRATRATIVLVYKYGTARLWIGELDDPTAPDTCICVDTPAWFTWLGTVTTTSFSYPVYDHAHGYIDGFMTVRKEQRQRGAGYWVAYRRYAGRLQKVYLGATTALTQAHLDTIAQTFLAARQALGSDEGTNGASK